jgi:hypothetical protein
MDFAKKFKGYLRTATPLVLVHTFDGRATELNIINVLREATDAEGKSLLADTGISQWDIARGLQGVNELGQTQVQQFMMGAKIPPEALLMAENLYKVLAAAKPEVLTNHITFVFNAHKVWGNPTELQGLYNLRDVLKEKSSMLVLLAAPGSAPPEEIAQDVQYLDEPLPDTEEVEAIFNHAYAMARRLADQSKKKIPDALPKATLKKAVAALHGMPKFPIEQASQLCIDAMTGNVDIPELWGHKRQVISQRAGLSMYDGKATLKNLSNMDNVVTFLQRYNAGPEAPNIILRFDEMEKAFAGSGTDLSGDQTKLTGSILTWFQDKRINFIIFLGVPGCGKTELVYSFANDIEKPVIDVNLPGMQGSLLGQSMANLQAAEKTIDAMGGGRVLAIATVNDVSTLPAPLLSRSNLGIFFFDIPKTDAERIQILNIHRKKYGIKDTEAAPDMNLWTGRDIENCCKRAYLLGETLPQAAVNVVKVMDARREEMERLRQGADHKYISASKAGVYEWYDPWAKAAVSTAEVGRKLREV